MLQEFVDAFEPHHLLIQLVPKPHLVAVLELLQSELKYAFGKILLHQNLTMCNHCWQNGIDSSCSTLQFFWSRLLTLDSDIQLE